LTEQSNTLSLQQELQAALVYAHATLDDKTYGMIDSSADDATTILTLVNNLDLDDIEPNDLQMSLKRLRRKSEHLLRNLTDLCRLLSLSDRPLLKKHDINDSITLHSRSASFSQYDSGEMTSARQPPREQRLLRDRAESRLSNTPDQQLVQYVPKAEARSSSSLSQPNMTAASSEFPLSGAKCRYVYRDGRLEPRFFTKLASRRQSFRPSGDHSGRIHMLSESPQMQEIQNSSQKNTALKANGYSKPMTPHTRPIAWQLERERCAITTSVTGLSLAERIERRRKARDGEVYTAVDDTHGMKFADEVPGLAR